MLAVRLRVCGADGLHDRPPDRGTGADADTRARLLNIHSGRARDGSLDLATVASELRAWDADVVMLQEVDRGRERSDFAAQARELGERLGLDHAYGPTRQLRPGTTGNAVLSRFPVREIRNRALPRLPGLFRRGVLVATIDVEGREVEVMSTHLDHARPAARSPRSTGPASTTRGLTSARAAA